MTTSGDLVLGQINGHNITVNQLIEHLSTMDDNTVLGTPDGETLTVADALMQLHRTALLPKPVPAEQRLPDGAWAEAVLRGEAPYGRCPFCRAAKGTAGCLNMCEYPAAVAQGFTNNMMAFLAHRRAQIQWVENLGGCTCGPAKLNGYAIERDRHDHRCPMSHTNHSTAPH